MSHECPTCGDEFENKLGLAVHHGRSHDLSLKETRALNNGNPQECPTCGGIFDGYRGVSSHHVQAHGESIAGFEKICEVCGDSFIGEKQSSDRRFCSRDCYGDWRSEYITGEDNPQYTGGQVHHQCDYCGKGFTSKPGNSENRRFCSRECDSSWRRENYSGVDHPLWSGGTTTYYGPNWREQREKARERDNYQCQSCAVKQEDHPRRLPVHHKTPRSTFIDEEGVLDYKSANRLENLITLCDRCHPVYERMAPLVPTRN